MSSLGASSGIYDDAWIFDIDRKVAQKDDTNKRGTPFFSHSPTVVTKEGEIASLVQIMKPREPKSLQVMKVDKYLN